MDAETGIRTYTDPVAMSGARLSRVPNGARRRRELKGSNEAQAQIYRIYDAVPLEQARKLVSEHSASCLQRHLL